MELKNINIAYTTLLLEELDLDERDLLAKACDSAQNAYAPYSKFQVGCALRFADGQIFVGNNQENVAYPSGLCAERVAVFAAKAQNPNGVIRKMCIVALKDKDLTSEPITPCGACLQVLLEVEKRQQKPIELYFVGKEKVIKVKSVEHCLPFAFLSF